MTAVRMSIPVTVLRSALRLPDDAEILAAVPEARPDEALALTLMIRFPAAPAAAARADPDYAVPPASWSGPVVLMGVRWLDADGSEIRPDAPGEPAPPEPAAESGPQPPPRRWWYPFGLGGLSDEEPQ